MCSMLHRLRRLCIHASRRYPTGPVISHGADQKELKTQLVLSCEAGNSKMHNGWQLWQSWQSFVTTCCTIDTTSPFIFPESMQDGVEVWQEACGLIRASMV